MLTDHEQVFLDMDECSQFKVLALSSCPRHQLLALRLTLNKHYKIHITVMDVVTCPLRCLGDEENFLLDGVMLQLRAKGAVLANTLLKAS